MTQPTSEAIRIESLDILRGFALLGILLLNILGFGMLSASYSNPGFDLVAASTINWLIWGGIDICAEGAMRTLFSMLFGAGVVLFSKGERGKAAALHYKRTFLLLLIGLFDAFLLLWSGDILMCYAMVGFLLYLIRHWHVKSLLITAGVLLVLISLMYLGMNSALSLLKSAADEVAQSDDPISLSDETRSMAAEWDIFILDYEMTPESRADELEARNGSYLSAFRWNAEQVLEILIFVIPAILFWDVLVMMMLGMALYKAGVLQGEKSKMFYWRLMIAGFMVGLTINSFEVFRAVSSNMALLSTFGHMQFTYHFGRLGMAFGYIGLIILLLKAGVLGWLRMRLGAVGRMALTNYLMHSFICLFVFTGAGWGLVDELSRAQLYFVVFAIWVFQLWFSPWWLSRYRFGPVEWLWRALTYSERLANKRVTV